MTEKYNESMNERSSRKMPTSVPTTKDVEGLQLVRPAAGLSRSMAGSYGF